MVKALKAINGLNLAKLHLIAVPGSVHSGVLSILTKNNLITRHFSKKQSLSRRQLSPLKIIAASLYAASEDSSCLHSDIRSQNFLLNTVAFVFHLKNAFQRHSRFLYLIKLLEFFSPAIVEVGHNL